ncbi:MAG: class I SAM-dependent methyltransferase [Verrucomicrobia bacterium]|nr:class I SAM-dependent methyltransferase [Verrucomicrobiota bacterium]
MQATPAKTWRDRLRPLKRRAEEVMFRFSSHPRLRGRYQLPTLLNARGLLGVGLEVGVFEGWFSNYLLNGWRGRRLISVDPWRAWGADYHDPCNQTQAEMDRCYETTRQLLAPHGGRSEIWRSTSQDAAAKVADASLDFVYIDAQHHETAVTEDLQLWYPKLRPDGLLAGHDYMDAEFGWGSFGVKTAVDRFVAAQHLLLGVTGEAWAPSWFLFKSS